MDLLAPDHVRREGESPFVTRVMVRWRGASVERAKHEARVAFPDGETTSVTMDRALIIEWIEGEVEAG